MGLMAKSYKLDTAIVKQIVQSHENYWEHERQELWKYKAVYETRFWNQESKIDSQLYVQTADAYGFIESYIASLFSRNPGVIVKSGLKGRGNPSVAQHLANDFLIFQRKELENAARIALIYPMSFLKLVPTGKADIYRKIDCLALPPWEVILDRDARRWEDQRYVGHKYFMTMTDAKDKFGDKHFEGIYKKDYFEQYESETKKPENIGSQDFDYYKYIEMVELYDLATQRVYFWTPQWKMGDKFLLAEDIPFQDPKGDAVLPIVPFYFNRMPDQPLDGYSAMRRIYDQIYETNLIRTFQANAVRKCSRQYLVKKGSIDEEQMAQVISGFDGLFIEIDAETMDGIIRPLPHNPTPPELEAYYRQVQADKDKGSIMAPFTRGESVRASATEITALAAYTSSEVGRLARERDSSIEDLCRAYLYMLALYLEEDNVRELISVGGNPTVVSPIDLDEMFIVFAQDQAQTPLSESVKKREFLQSIPMLQQLGVPEITILKEMVRALNLPEDFIMEAEERTARISAAQAELAGSAVQPDAVELGMAPQAPGGPQGPANLQGILPGARSIS
jgi:hypothetical protein